ncbi:hypothetical protein R1flu_002385 [Riccia fluitans]|uniref:Uncharacterized protein n=1 Tax=Riccia fluitans TaxID=41844 RepID=A0ABD1Y649_9MARC
MNKVLILNLPRIELHAVWEHIDEPYVRALWPHATSMLVTGGRSTERWLLIPEAATEEFFFEDLPDMVRRRAPWCLETYASYGITPEQLRQAESVSIGVPDPINYLGRSGLLLPGLRQ